MSDQRYLIHSGDIVAAVIVAVGKPRTQAMMLILIAMSFALLTRADPARAQDPAAGAQPPAQDADDPRAQWYDCSCYDEPSKHYPYSIVVFKTAQGDLVTRPERREGALTFSPLALRFGTRYCTVESEQDCYGSFSHPCEFTDFRYGPYLAEFFPTCKSDEIEPE
jgi:hypothetical protein